MENTALIVSLIIYLILASFGILILVIWKELRKGLFGKKLPEYIYEKGTFKEVFKKLFSIKSLSIIFAIFIIVSIIEILLNNIEIKYLNPDSILYELLLICSILFFVCSDQKGSFWGKFKQIVFKKGAGIFLLMIFKWAI